MHVKIREWDFNKNLDTSNLTPTSFEEKEFVQRLKHKKVDQ